MSQAITQLHQHSTRPLRNSSQCDGTSKGTAQSPDGRAARWSQSLVWKLLVAVAPPNPAASAKSRGIHMQLNIWALGR